jgi:hypothetical protein
MLFVFDVLYLYICVYVLLKLKTYSLNLAFFLYVKRLNIFLQRVLKPVLNCNIDHIRISIRLYLDKTVRSMTLGNVHATV